MKIHFLLPAFVFALTASASTTFSFTGTLATPEDVFEQTFNLATPGDVEIETFGFGGGTNGQGAVIPAGGFDPLVALFSADGTILTDTFGNPIAGADTLSSFIGNCPPANTVVIGTGTGSSICGDVFLQATSLAAGTYLLVLSDANNIPYAVDPGPPASSLLSDGFNDLTSGVFQTCNTTSDGTFCITPTANFGVDIIGATSIPEPGSAALIVMAIAGIAAIKRRKN